MSRYLRRAQPRCRARARLALLAALAIPLLPGVARAGSEVMRFAARMAQEGNWREAYFRWKLAAEEHPDNPRILNNLAVSLEALGRFDEASVAYARALELSGGDVSIDDNRRGFERFRESTRAPGDPEASLEGPAVRSSGRRTQGKSIKVGVALPVPPRIDISGARALLVTSFLTPEENPLLDLNRELVRFVRGKYRGRLDLDVLDVNPPPAVPEQPLEDLAANAEFWKHLGREFSADVIVSGLATFERRDYSGFRDVDVISPVTGQKLRTTRFVEQERFTYEVDLLFLDGASGAVLHRERLQRSAVYPDSQNDALTAFFDLSESMTDDLLAIVKTRTQEETRVIYKS